MKIPSLVALILAAGATVLGQEKPVPKDSVRLSIPGCAYDRLFIVDVNPEHEVPRTELQPGRRLRLNGPKKIMEEIKARKGSMIEITGLIRKNDLIEPGIKIGGGVRIMPAMPPVGNPSAGRDSGVSQSIVDVESWQLLNISCPDR